MAENLPDEQVRRLLSLAADRAGGSSAPDPAGLVRRAGRRDRARRTGAVAAVLLAVLAVVLPVGLFAANRDTTPPQPADSAAPAPSQLGTAAALAAGRWEDLPPAPISPRTSPAYAWTGSELLVWGGYASGTEAPTRLSDGASYDPATKTWTLLPPGPLEAVPNPLSAWTGSQWLILGSTPSDTQVRQQLVSYDPATRAWTELSLPEGRLLLRSVGRTTTAAWTGRELVVVGFEGPGSANGKGVAAYDPVTRAWRDLPDLPEPVGQATLAREAGAVDGDVIVLSEWDGQADVVTSAGVSAWRLDPEQDTWTAVAGDDPEGLSEPVLTPDGLLLPGAPGVCPGNVSCLRMGGVSGRQLGGASWSSLPDSPVADGRGVWTGSVLVVADGQTVGPGAVEVNPGQAAAYDPTERTWTSLPASGGVGTDGGVVVWTGQELIVWGSRPCGPAEVCVKQAQLQTGRVLVPAPPQPDETATATPTTGPGVGRVSFLPEQAAYPDSLLDGTLGGDVTTGCLWTEVGPGKDDRVPFRLHEDTAELDVTVEPPVIRDGTRVLAAFGDEVEMGGGFVGASAPGCAALGEPFSGNSLQRMDEAPPR